MMNKVIVVCICAIYSISIYGQIVRDDDSVLKDEIQQMQFRQTEFEQKVRRINAQIKQNEGRIQSLERSYEVLCGRMDSLMEVCNGLQKTQEANRRTIDEQIQTANHAIESNHLIVQRRSAWGVMLVVLVAIAIALMVWLLTKKINKSVLSIEEVAKAQDALSKAQRRLQEESLKLDDQMLMLLEKQISAVPKETASVEIDHSLALKVADEIVRIELNLSRMDSSVKGYKQLSKAVERIKSNFLANGYEIIDMLGKPYNEGMKVVANFVPDETLKEGEQIIIGITKPQINYNGKMIQSAQITVSQNI